MSGIRQHIDQMRAMGELPYEARLENEVSRLRAENAQLKAELAQATQREARLRKVLTELYALVRGECPRLLNEDSGGDAELDL